jgi:hypothetical protein
MTLVLSALTPRQLVQVSDRRVVFRYPSGKETLRDGHVKAVITQGFACSYSGVADLGGDTADWLAVLLSDHAEAPDGGISMIGPAAEKELAKRGLSDEPLWVADRSGRGTAFCGVSDRSTPVRRGAGRCQPCRDEALHDR